MANADKPNIGERQMKKGIKSIFCIRRISKTAMPEEIGALFYMMPSENNSTSQKLISLNSVLGSSGSSEQLPF